MTTRCYAFTLAILGILLLPPSFAEEKPGAGPKPLVNCHSHNDYLQPRPLLDALDCGLSSVEADVFLVDGRLLVGHYKFQTRSDHTLQSLYLDPLRARVKQNGGRVYPQGNRSQGGKEGDRAMFSGKAETRTNADSPKNGPVPARPMNGDTQGPVHTLLVEIKSPPTETYAVLRKVLAEYADILSVVEDGKLTERAVRVVITGRQPREQLRNDSPRYAALDGGLHEIASDAPAHLIPQISGPWNAYFTWRGEGPMPQEQRTKLRELAAQARKSNRLLRFWAAPDNPAVWRELRAAGENVIINTDKLDGLRKFFDAG